MILMSLDQTSYYVSVGAFVVVIGSWFAFAAAFMLRRRPAPAKDAVKAPRSWLGLGLQLISYPAVWAVQRSPAFSPFAGDNYLLNIILQAGAAVLAVASVVLAMSAIRELGRQWSLQARLLEGHKLVTTGPYQLVRHPIYTAMLGMLIATGITLSHWAVLLPSVVVFLIGTFVRNSFEEGLLGDAFGEEFFEWKARVPSLVPFIKF